MIKRLNKNPDCYLGETIDIERVISDCVELAQKFGFELEIISVDGGEDIVVLKKTPKEVSKRIYISSGIHGDEPAGPLSVLKLIENNNWPDTLQVILLPCLNPLGFKLNTRENDKCVDLNRDYYHCRTPEICAHVNWLEKNSNFDMTICLHEDWGADGFYLYECLHDDNSFAKNIIESVGEVFPIDRSKEIDGHDAAEGVIGPPDNHCVDDCVPEAIYLFEKKKLPNYTLETSSDFPLESRVEAMVRAVGVIVRRMG